MISPRGCGPRRAAANRDGGDANGLEARFRRPYAEHRREEAVIGMRAPRVLVSRPRDSWHNCRAGHPRWLRCSSLKYVQYSRSSRLAIGAPRSGIYATNHAAGTPGAIAEPGVGVN